MNNQNSIRQSRYFKKILQNVEKRIKKLEENCDTEEKEIRIDQLKHYSQNISRVRKQIQDEIYTG